jgi:hypothetical protein
VSTLLHSNRERIKVLSGQLAGYVQSKGKSDLQAELAEVNRTLSSKDAFVVVCGEFKMGKSSLVNAFLEQDKLCPVDSDIATCVVSIIRYGTTPKVIRHYGDPTGGGRKEEVPVGDIKKYCVGTEEAIQKTYLLEIELPNPRLKEGLVLMDTPGVGGMDPRHGLLTAYFMPKADVCFYVFDGQPLTTDQISFIQGKILPRCRHLIFVLNGKDRFGTEEKVGAKVNQARGEISQSLGLPADRLRVVAVSALSKLQYLASGDAGDLEASNFCALENELPIALTERERDLQLFSLDRLTRMVERLRGPLLAQSERVRQNSGTELQQFKERCEARRQQMDDLLSPSAEWRAGSTKIIQDSIGKARTQLRKEVLHMQSSLSEYAEDERLSKNVELLVRQLERDIQELVLKVDDIVDSGFEKAAKAIKKSIHIDLELLWDEGEAPSFDVSLDRSRLSRELGQDKLSKAWMYSRGSVMGAGIGGALFGTIGAIVGSSFLGPLGLIVGVGLAVKEVRASLQRSTVAAIREKFTPLLQQMGIDLEEYVSNRIKQKQETLQAAITAESKNAQAAYKETLDAFRTADRRSRDESAAVQNSVEGELRLLDSVATGIKGLRQGLLTQTAAAVT